MAYKVGIDIGGTFTDCVVIDDKGRTTIAKALTTSNDPSQGVMDALALACQTLGRPVEKLLNNCEAFFHSCTVATNAIIERTGAKTAFVTTRGHEDMLLIGKSNQKVAGLTEQEIIHTSRLTRAEPPLVPRRLVFGVNERVIWNGEVLIPLKQAELDRLVEWLSAQDIESVAICLLWSFMNPAHEQQIKEVVEKKLPHIYCSISSEISPTFGEYERATATVINSYVGPKLKNYLEKLQSRLNEAGYRRPLLSMQCEGGTTYAADAARRAVLTIDSGPVGGVAGGKWLSRIYQEPNIICTDVGGTSFDVGLIYRGEPQREDEPVIEKYRFRIPKVDISSIGAGGGSIAWVDAAGFLKVGPRSAGANPGPACYGRGGQEPTVTDADLVLGYLNPDYFLGGALKLDRGLAEQALSKLAKQMKMDIIGTAQAIFRIMNAQMADLIRKCSVERGFDPRSFSLIAYGGAGPTHVAFYSADVGARSIYVLPNATVFSAFGLLTSPITHYGVMSRRTGSPYSSEDCHHLNEAFAWLKKGILDQFKTEGISPDKVDLTRSVSMRYKMQVHEIETEINDEQITPDSLDRVIIPDFESKYSDIYGSGTEAKEAGTEIISCRVIGKYQQFVVEPSAEVSPAVGRRRPQPKGKRQAFFEVNGKLTGLDTEVFDGGKLAGGDFLTGPAIVERYGDAIVIPPGYTGEVDARGTMKLEKNSKS